MSKKKRGGDKMTTMTLAELETSVRSNNRKYRDVLTKFEKKAKSKNTVKGRVRPKHPTEAKILSMFSKK
ncbi:hypothetical protein [Rossellomorea sp. DA94]|uniref:hypothetical protein n=1 Tax=Rossellomorea sp. DA94 TaxID=3038653 RepID=UPI0024480525|nr:hypothetical protein [Rossellomorea sp. DA94]WGG47666.1 hypothetical protein P8596_10850 [Rossellomorea sp. DA94]